MIRFGTQIGSVSKGVAALLVVDTRFSNSSSIFSHLPQGGKKQFPSDSSKQATYSLGQSEASLHAMGKSISRFEDIEMCLGVVGKVAMRIESSIENWVSAGVVETSRLASLTDSTFCLGGTEVGSVSVVLFSLVSWSKNKGETPTKPSFEDFESFEALALLK